MIPLIPKLVLLDIDDMDPVCLDQNEYEVFGHQKVNGKIFSQINREQNENPNNKERKVLRNQHQKQTPYLSRKRYVHKKFEIARF